MLLKVVIHTLMCYYRLVVLVVLVYELSYYHVYFLTKLLAKPLPFLFSSKLTDITFYNHRMYK